MSTPTAPAWLTSCMRGIGLTGGTDMEPLPAFESELRDELLALLSTGAGGYRPGAGARQSLHLLRALDAAAESGGPAFRLQRAQLGLLLLWRMLDTPPAWDGATMPASTLAQVCLEKLRTAADTHEVIRGLADDIALGAVGEAQQARWLAMGRA